MSGLIRRIVKFGISRARQSSLVRSVLEGARPKKSYRVFGSFLDSRGNTFELLEGLRDDMKPNWRVMLDLGDDFHLPSRRELNISIIQARSSIREVRSVLQAHSYDLPGKKILEIGCNNGARTYALAVQAQGAEVIGSDFSSYYVLQRVDGELTEKSVSEQHKHLGSLRKAVASVINGDVREKTSVCFVEDDICNSSLPSESFDLVCSWEVLEHIREPEKAFHHIHRILKTGGIAFHQYNPFFCLTGGHSLCSLDFHWGHIRLDTNDFMRYLAEIRPAEAGLAERFYRNNLNRMALFDLRRYGREAGFQTLALITWPNAGHLELVDEEILSQSVEVFPSLTLLDLITSNVWLLQLKV